MSPCRAAEFLGLFGPPRDSDPVPALLEAPSACQADTSGATGNEPYPPILMASEQGLVLVSRHPDAPAGCCASTGAPPQRTTALAQVIPAPKPENSTRSPSFRRPA